MKIDIELKKECVELFNGGKTYREIFNEHFLPHHSGMSYATFRRRMQEWRKKCYADETTLAAGTYPGFTAHNATVQVDGQGKVVQAWVKQTDEQSQIPELIEAIKEHTLPTAPILPPISVKQRMLELPLFDLHFPLTDYSEQLSRIIDLITASDREAIYIIIGQDLFHNDDFRGRTSSGREIEKVNIVDAWDKAHQFFRYIILTAEKHAKQVKIIYSKGNHDESLGWAFVQMLAIEFPAVAVDDGLEQRKCISWQQCFIGITHGAYKKSTNNDLRGQFTIQFPIEFAEAKVREIHAGHLHHELEGDCYGVMVRRLASANRTDDWSEDEGFVGSHKRLMAFEFEPGRLNGIYYL